ncbi:MAG: hypothetical protein H7251_11685 [Acetobacteraceae bacterium]|nr:hypothetical protein [Acetobacteraceae bacterium]
MIFVGATQAASMLRADDAVLVEDGLLIGCHRPIGRFTQGATAHVIGCRCCAGRAAPAQALTAMFLARARGEGTFFRRVIAVVHDVGLVRGLLEDDVVVRARFQVVDQA